MIATLRKFFRASYACGYIAAAWREAKVMYTYYISKAEKTRDELS